MAPEAFDKRYCSDKTGGVSYWLLTPKDYKKCGKNGADDPKCAAFELAAGYDALKTSKYQVSLDDLMLG